MLSHCVYISEEAFIYRKKGVVCLEDNRIIDLYWERSEQAVVETDRKYGKYCYRIAYNILANKEDAEESVSDTYMKAWETMPPKRPSILAAFLGKITRNLSISRWRGRTAEKRGGGEMALTLEELNECVSGSGEPEAVAQYKETAAAYRQFVGTLPETERNVFIRRYFFMDPVAVIAGAFGYSEGKVKVMLHRTRTKLRCYLEREGLL